MAMSNQPQDWNEDDLLGLVADRAQESLTLEFKACDALTNKRWKTELAKDVSAFANSAGGTIIYGIREDEHTHEAGSIDVGYDPGEINKERLEQIINSNIHRRIEGVRINAIVLHRTRPGNVLFVIHVPESGRAPHMADHRFYKRFEFASVPMEEYEVRERYRRETYPSKDIIRAWFDDALNPLISELVGEEDCLMKEYWTWNHLNNAFGGLMAKSEPINPSPNQEDFLSRHPGIKDSLLQHDKALEMLNEQGVLFFKQVLGGSCLRDAFRRTTSEDSLKALKAEHPYNLKGDTAEEIFAEIFGSNRSEDERLAWFAEYSINRTRMLQNDSIMPFWRRHQEEFFQVPMQPLLSEPRARVVDHRENLSRINQEFIASLKKIRKKLSEQHGVPFNESRWMVSDPWGSGFGSYPRYKL
jgi:hypothetical protein